jgi:2-polyprenyl-3-methyl-5-hydroxy-6-metoxy-1,4-benzoquinol methylase
MNDKWFENWFNSSYYHQLYAHRDELEAASFINKLISFLQPPSNARMLDVACGKGRHSLQLAAKGFDVTGIDLSSESIKTANLQANENLHFYEHDMRMPFAINYFDVAFNFFTSFGYFKTQREHDNAIATIAKALKPNGKFVLDFLNVSPVKNISITNDTIQLEDVTYLTTKHSDENYFYKKIEVHDKAIPEPLIFTEKVRKFMLADFEKMFAKQNLHITELFGDYNLNKYEVSTSPRLIIVATKKH